MIRPLQAKDIPRLRELHAASGFAWEFPDLRSFLSAQVFVDENDIPVILIGARPMAEVVGIFDPAWETAGVKMAAFTALYGAVEADCRAAGIKEVVAWLPPQIAKAFSRRLRRHFSWVENRWACMVGFVRER
jgi:hypothetical protein